MASDINLSRIEKENSVLFGLKWSMVGISLALLLLAGCSSLFDERVPRYNTVEGPRRAPIYNPSGGAGQPSPQAVQQQAQQSYQQAQKVQRQPSSVPQPRPQQPALQKVRQHRSEQDDSWFSGITNLFSSEQPQQSQQPPMPMTRQVPVQQQQAAPVYNAGSAPMPKQLIAAQQRNVMARNVEKQINALEAELDAADAQRAQVARSAQNDGWPELGANDMSSNGYAAPIHPATIQPSNSGYKVVKLPPPPPRGTVGTGFQPIPSAQQPQAQPSMATQAQPVINQSAPMPPMIATAPIHTKDNVPVRYEMQPSIDVPLAPDIGLTAPQSVNVPISLVPPSSTGVDGAYLPESRYTGRNYLSYPRR